MMYLSSIKLHKIARFAIWGVLWVSLALLLSGCQDEAEATISPEQARTSIAQTVTAAIAETQAVMPTNTLSPTFTLTATESPTATPVSSPTPQAAQATAPVPPVSQSTSCDSAIFITDVTIPDGTDLAPGSTFTKTWRLQNSGTCTWASTYALAYANGDLLEASSPAYLDVDTVTSGESMDISVAMVAPDTAGSYTSYWQMQNASGAGFGDTVYVQIDVLGSLSITSTPTYTPTNTSTPTAIDEITATPTATDISEATSTSEPTSTPSPVYTSTPEPTQTALPSDTPIPTATLIPTEESLPTDTPVPTSTPEPINTPEPTSTPTP